MDKRIKIALGVIIFLAILSGAFLLFAKKSNTANTANSAVQKKVAPAVKNSTVAPVGGSGAVKKLESSPTSTSTQSGLPQTSTQSAASISSSSPSKSPVSPKLSVNSQWSQCKAKTLAANTDLFWSVKVTEAIPLKGTYAKGNLIGDVKMPVHIIVRSDSKIADKIKAMLVVGKTAFLRGTCSEVAADGSVVFQAF